MDPYFIQISPGGTIQFNLFLPYMNKKRRIEMADVYLDGRDPLTPQLKSGKIEFSGQIYHPP